MLPSPQETHSFGPLGALVHFLKGSRAPKHLQRIEKALNDSKRIGREGISLEDALTTFETIEHPNKILIFETLAEVAMNSTGEEKDFLFKKSSTDLSRGTGVQNYIAAAARILLAASTQDKLEKYSLLRDAAFHFLAASTYKEAAFSSLLAYSMFSNDDNQNASELKQIAGQSLRMAIEELQAFGLNFNALLAGGAIVCKMRELGMIPQDKLLEVEGFMRAHIRDLG